MIRSAPRRLAAMTAHSPTAPSPTTATVSPGLTPALNAAWWPVHITSDSATGDFMTASERPLPGTLTSVASVNGARVRGVFEARVGALADGDGAGGRRRERTA